MSRARAFLTLSAVPTSPDVGLLLLRLWLGASMFTLHGLGKVERLQADPVQFADPFGFGPGASLLLALGLGTRWAALALSVTMATAFVFAHGMALSGERSGELPFVYAAGFVAILVMGPGRYSVDARLR
jgi:putative oxidoreductase